MKRVITFFIVVFIFVLFYNWRLIYDAVQMQTANSLYEQGKYSEARDIYEHVSSIKGSYLLPPLLHNLGNTLYRIGESASGSANKSINWQGALDVYKKALSLKKDPETVANYEFVRKKYEQIKKEEDQKEQQKKQEEQKKEEPKKDEKTGSGAKQDEKKDTTGEKKDTSGKEGTPKETGKEGSGQQPSTTPWTNQGAYNSVGGQSKDNEQVPVSAEERQEIENYLQSLRDFQKQNGKFLTPDGLENKGGSVSDQIDSFFRNDPFFRDALPNNSDPTKKDW